jgi:hypothetical protein
MEYWNNGMMEYWVLKPECWNNGILEWWVSEAGRTAIIMTNDKAQSSNKYQMSKLKVQMNDK